MCLDPDNIPVVLFLQPSDGILFIIHLTVSFILSSWRRSRIGYDSHSGEFSSCCLSFELNWTTKHMIHPGKVYNLILPTKHFSALQKWTRYSTGGKKQFRPMSNVNSKFWNSCKKKKKKMKRLSHLPLIVTLKTTTQVGQRNQCPRIFQNEISQQAASCL